ncbi:carcinoembryonic antigen-related cell adhesion molecule 5-like isoform X1 [Sphaerodactylus townsendi]|uniref:carcinoembryonic antigen-related cell adhesion molecule 5-like isoform X1 n=1 Tax=Sphaerodactylus townsendi TaxID=933632 RepID=UPI002025EC48|nr:carcinoembryonic antigen-related cell adhesion molecule 5-like isoform X1 [Sphaerodactylus townsendi]
MGRRAAEEPWPARGSPGRWSSWPAALLAASVLNSCFLLTQAQNISVELDPKWPLKGHTVTLTPAGKTEIITCTWFRDEQIESKEIFTYVPSISEQQNGPAFTGRETAGPNCSLAIKLLTFEDTGIYIVRKTVRGGPETGRAHVQVSERVSNVSITSHPAKVIENELTVLTCSSVGTNVSYVWSKGGQTLESAGHISVNYSSLTFNPTWRNDTGSYTCYGHNSFSNSSATYPLKVFYGPAVPIISPQQYDYAEGSAFTLHCRADSLPPPEYTWSFNGSEFPEKSPQLSIPSLSFDMAGNYTCSAFNSETNLSSSSTLKIRVLEKVFNVSIQGPSETTENDSVNLTCSSRGSEVSYTWFKENQTLEDGGHILLWGPNHEMLTLNPVQRSDAGSYTCRGNNSVSDDTSDPFPLDVFYGPDDPIITPQEHNYLQGKDLNLRCQADSKPVAQYTWFFNEMEEIGNGSQLLIPGLSFNNSGNYTCNATNIKTGTSRATVWEIRVLEKLSPPTLWPKELSVKEHANVTLNCTTSEHSSVTVSWYKDGKPIPDKAALSERNRTLTIPDISKADAGTYTCEAKNGANNATSNPSKIFVEDGPGPPFPPGAIVGIVIGCLAGVALIVVVLYCTLKNTTLGRMAQLSSNGNIILHPRHWCYRSPAAGSRDSV